MFDLLTNATDFVKANAELIAVLGMVLTTSAAAFVTALSLGIRDSIREDRAAARCTHREDTTA